MYKTKFIHTSIQIQVRMTYKYCRNQTQKLKQTEDRNRFHRLTEDRRFRSFQTIEKKKEKIKAMFYKVDSLYYKHNIRLLNAKRF